ncbi:citrate (pro-3S)-lyase subunit beta [Petroclostridium sp. X23]|uniref:citrate (pro-3S)-lyase subunit beta n=1 Tax=Petroclostridium sp. X23 TaxID=3045146 RepID=UPI0024AE1BBD|nr:citrate (pro-3S)-lyase subunit beta [Petroclostridium sp. X23]WHH61203.1 citrate (pro-3S)-lyase subunit beta [Petroclostridium sp. X23]
MAYQKTRLRRTMMFIPGNNPGMMKDAHLYGADSLMFDLEDSVKLEEKDAARYLVYNALTTLDYGDIEKVVRINPLNTSLGKADIEMMVKAGVNIIRLPKSETAQDIIDVDNYIALCEERYGVEIGSTGMMAAIESALGVINAYDIAKASKRLVGIALGAEDYVTDLKAKRTASGVELFAARTQIIIAARAAGIAALDTVFSDVNDEDGFRKEVQLIKDMGFDGKSVLNPRQIEPVIEIFTPTQKEIEHAERVIEALKEAESKGLGVISLNGKMIDKPVVIRAKHTLELAEAAGIYMRN